MGLGGYRIQVDQGAPSGLDWSHDTRAWAVHGLFRGRFALGPGFAFAEALFGAAHVDAEVSGVQGVAHEAAWSPAYGFGGGLGLDLGPWHVGLRLAWLGFRVPAVDLLTYESGGIGDGLMAGLEVGFGLGSRAGAGGSGGIP